MARRVFFHVGTLKTGTTYLQKVLWRNRTVLAQAGLLVPGEHYSDRVWATRSVRGMRGKGEPVDSAWDRIVAQVQEFDGDAVISHEFFGGASQEQASRAIAALAPAEVHVVCTVRALEGVLPGFWQEQVKFGYTGRFADYDPAPLDSSPATHWSWRTIDAADVLRRWAADVPPERVHVVTFPPAGAPRDLLWQRFAGVCGVDPGVADLRLPPVNESLGVVETELLRRVNQRLPADVTGRGETARWVRGYLGLEVLAPRGGEKVRLDAARTLALRERSAEIAAALEHAGYDVVGDLADVFGSGEPTPSRQPEEVADSELLEVSLAVIGRLMSDHRRLTLANEDRASKRSRSRTSAGPRAASVSARARRTRARARALTTRVLRRIGSDR